MVEEEYVSIDYLWFCKEFFERLKDCLKLRDIMRDSNFPYEDSSKQAII